MTAKQLSMDEFDATYEMITPTGDDDHESLMWEHEQTLTQDLHHVWSIVEGDEDETQYAIAGYHVVNVVGYCVTKRPWVTGEEIGIYCDTIDRMNGDDNGGAACR